jgi:hypothetical protein
MQAEEPSSLSGDAWHDGRAKAGDCQAEPRRRWRVFKNLGNQLKVSGFNDRLAGE